MIVNICGVLVHARPEHAAAVAATLADMPGVEVHASTDDGRIVVCIEERPDALAADTLAAIHGVGGVIGAALVYQVVWQRTLFAIYGIDSTSVTVVVTAFMLGLGAAQRQLRLGRQPG